MQQSRNEHGGGWEQVVSYPYNIHMHMAWAKASGSSLM
jgi:hypothetical protein